MSERDVISENVRALMATSFGREIIWEILERCGLYAHIPENQGLALGRRAVGLDILEMLEDADCTLYPKLLLTRNKDTKND